MLLTSVFATVTPCARAVGQDRANTIGIPFVRPTWGDCKTHLGDTQVAGQHIGILLVEFGVFLSVFSVLLLIFYCFVSR